MTGVLFVLHADRLSRAELPSVDFWCCLITSTRWPATSLQARQPASHRVSAAVRYGCML